MAVEPLFTGTAAIVAVLAPPVFMRVLKTNGVVAFLGSVIAANVISELVFRWAKPDFQYGGLAGLGIVMNVAMTLMLAGISVAVAAVVFDWIDFKETHQ